MADRLNPAKRNLRPGCCFFTHKKRTRRNIPGLTDPLQPFTQPNSDTSFPPLQGLSRLQAIFNSTTVGILLYQVDGKLTQANPQMAQMLGYTVEELFQHSITDLTYPEDLRASQELYARLLRREISSYELEKRYIRKDGSLIWVHISVTAILDTNGKVDSILSLTNNITARIEAEEKRRESEERFRLLAENSSDVIGCYDKNGEVVYISPACRLVLGFSPQELTAEYMTLRIHPEDRAAVLNTFLQTTHNQKTSHIHYRFLHADGQYRWFDTIILCINDPHTGEMIEWITTTRDITERMDYESNLERQLKALTQPEGDFSQVKFEDLFDLNEIQAIQDAFAHATGVASIIFDPQLREITRPTNSRLLCSQIIQYTPVGRANCFFSDNKLLQHANQTTRVTHCLSANLWDTATPITIGNTTIAYWVIGQVLDKEVDEKRLLEYGQKIGADLDKFKKAIVEMPRMSREEFQNVTNALCLFARQLSLLALRNVQQAQAITQLTQSEEKVRMLNQNLEQRVRERTRQLEATNKELEAFSYSVSHDLRAPLRSLQGFSQILLEDKSEQLDAEGQNYLQRINLAAQQMNHLVSDLLKLSRLTQGEIHLQTVNLSLMAKEIIDTLMETEPERQVIVTIPEELNVTADANLIRIALGNLLCNAWKFTSHHPQAKIALGCFEKEDERVFYVKDDGAGFQMEFASKLFSAFQRLHTQSEFEGSGIGLAIVQRIINRHNGKIWAEAAPEQGATFFFTLGNA